MRGLKIGNSCVLYSLNPGPPYRKLDTSGARRTTEASGAGVQGEPTFMSRHDDDDESWYRRILDSMSDYVFVKDTRSRLVWANRQFCSYYGMTPEELVDIVEPPTTDPDDVVHYVKDDYQVIVEGKPLFIPREPFTDHEGTVRYIATVKSPIRDADDRVIGLVGSARLLTDEDSVATSRLERQRWKEHLSELRTLVYDLPLAAAMFDPQLRFLAYSQAWPATLGHEGPALTSEFYSDAFEQLLPLRAHCQAAMESREPVSVPAIEIALANRPTVIVNIEIRPWSTPTGRCGGVIVLLQDVTELYSANESLRRLNDELLQFNYRVSHDLLAPLKTVLGYLNLCEEELADGNLDEMSSFHAKMRLNLERLGGLVEDVLNLARADAVSAERCPVDIAALVAEIQEKFAEPIASASVQVTAQIDVGTVAVERVRLQQILENLIANAIKYHDPRRELRRVEIEARLEQPSLLVVTVGDNGLGFDEALRDTIFDLFMRGTSTHPGSGLGLYLVKKHLAQMQGTIEVLSCRDDTVFQLRVPVPPSAAGREESE